MFIPCHDIIKLAVDNNYFTKNSITSYWKFAILNQCFSIVIYDYVMEL